MITAMERVWIRHYTVRFAERYPEEVADLWNKIGVENYQAYQAAVLTKYLKWMKPPREDAGEIWMLIEKLEKEKGAIPHPLKGKQRYKVSVEEISDGRL